MHASRRDRNESIGIVGGGPAGLTAAHDLRLFGYRVTVYEATRELGGMMRLGVPEYRLDRRVQLRDRSDPRAGRRGLQPRSSVAERLPSSGAMAINELKAEIGGSAHVIVPLSVPKLIRSIAPETALVVPAEFGDGWSMSRSPKRSS